MRRALTAAVPLLAAALSAPALAAGAAPTTQASVAGPLTRPSVTAPSTRASVTPASGTPRTHFTVSFRVPVAVGTFASVIRRDTVSVSGPRRRGCLSSAARTVRAARRGSRARLTFSPGRRSWCAGRWHGTVVQTETLRCTAGPMHACPDLVIAPRTLARFYFRVRPPPSSTPPTPPGGDVPTFAGLISATTCPTSVTRPQLLPHPTAYTLTWNAATDPVTPNADIVYVIFVATAPGAENYAQPTWTTSAGARSFVTPSVPRIGPVYFVVRARNAAGHEDANTVERQGVIQCPPTP